MARTWNTLLGPLGTELRALGDLHVGDVFVGPDLRNVYRVTRDAGSHPNGWVTTVSLTGGREADPDGVWNYQPGTPMHLVVSGLPAGVGEVR